MESNSMIEEKGWKQLQYGVTSKNITLANKDNDSNMENKIDTLFVCKNNQKTQLKGCGSSLEIDDDDFKHNRYNKKYVE